MAFADLWFELSGELNVPTNLVMTKLNEALGSIYDDEEQQMWSFQIREADNWLTPGLVFQTGTTVPAPVSASAIPVTATPFSTGGMFSNTTNIIVTPYSRGFQFATDKGQIVAVPYTTGYQFSSESMARLAALPTTVDSGMITATPYSNQVIGDANATLAWQGYTGKRPFLTEMQIRSPFYSLYSIIAYDGVSTLTLDRPWMEPVPAGGNPQPYMVYQAYFPTPTADFKRFFEIRDLTNSGILDYWSYSQRDLADRDPQRVIFDMPTHAVFRGWDTRGAGTPNASATLGYPLYELWPHPLSQWPYTFSSLRRGPFLVNPSDTIPAPLTEDMLKWKTRESLYLFKAAQRGEQVQRGSGADWQFLAQAAAAEYKASRNRIGKRDVAIIDLFFTRFRRHPANRGAPFATIVGGLNVGGW